MRGHLLKALGTILALPILLFSTNLTHTAFSHSMSGMPSSQCQSACTNQQIPTNATEPQDLLKNKDIDPEPQEPYYLAFMGVGWTTTIIITAAYLLCWLRWRPPDLYKLNVAYRF